MMLEIKNISKTYAKGGDHYTALNDVTLNVTEGDFIAVVGPSGSGKSTLLYTIGGMIQPDSGQVFYRGSDIYKMKSREVNHYRKKNVGFVFQQFHLMPYLTVYENIKMADGLSENKTTRVEDLIEKCSLTALRNKYPSELSVGEKQRAAFIRAIASNPEILLADEPTGNLDPENSGILISLIEDFHTNGGTVLLVSHDINASKYAHRTISLRSGQLINEAQYNKGTNEE